MGLSMLAQAKPEKPQDKPWLFSLIWLSDGERLKASTIGGYLYHFSDEELHKS